MSWIVDTCILIDVLEADPDFALASADALDELAPRGLLISPVTFVELAPAFHGDLADQRAFLSALGVELAPPLPTDALLAAHRAWNRQIQRKRAGAAAKRPIADVLIGALANAHDGLLTRNPGDFRSLFPSLRLHVPSP